MCVSEGVLSCGNPMTSSLLAIFSSLCNAGSSTALPPPGSHLSSPSSPDSRGNSSQRAPTTLVQVTLWMTGIRLSLSHPARAPQRLRILGSQARGEGLGCVAGWSRGALVR